MPEMDGFEAARRISRECPDTRVVMLSGYVAPSHRAAAAHAGARALIAKGATFQQMLAILDAVREGRSYDGGIDIGMTLEARPEASLGAAKSVWRSDTAPVRCFRAGQSSPSKMARKTRMATRACRVVRPAA
jgi:DNA-binding NarL/FixJ family response regulator